MSEQRAVLNNPAGAVEMIKRQQAEIANLREQLRTAIPAIETLKRTRDELQAALGSNAPETPREPEGGGHGELCAFCGESCDIFAGDPGRWPLAFGRPDGTGEIRYHHSDCVTARLFTQSPPKTSCKPLASTDGGASPSRPSPSSVECPKCRTQLAFEGDVCGLCE